MTVKTYSVPNISCHHCVNTIERELKDVAGVTSVKALSLIHISEPTRPY